MSMIQAKAGILSPYVGDVQPKIGGTVPGPNTILPARASFRIIGPGCRSPGGGDTNPVLKETQP